ncbi:MAG: MATE family efflux transporter [Lachnospiraceae bacterium]|uniref:MATE family efflux transporter n=1 Tax=Roseburia hominis TaxID=301301 RepID=UPI001F2F680B|nr:MATE family efflux transporter [Roseburia hominis]MCI5713360.1 MATE family efflux transporter [Lachnospiraceae bacterium]MDD6170691.1 MATE family efflux transporter [Lachnospiraceae bacterium]MDY4840038.1 MATE family efflux transporter [Lachnospiraceae bacterium]
MKREKDFELELKQIAIPVTLQCLLQSSFSVVDQVMTGQLGSVSIAGIGLGGKFAWIYSVLVSAVAAAAGIMIAQYTGKKDERKAGKSFYLNLVLAIVLAVIFMILGIGFPKMIMGWYTKDASVIEMASGYLRIVSFTFLPMAVSTLLSTYLRCNGKAAIPLYVSILSAILNTGFNWLLIFGNLGFPALGADGAALATAISQVGGCILMIILFLSLKRKNNWDLPFSLRQGRAEWLQFVGIFAPILICEFLWSLGENVYAAIYGHIGTAECAAMTVTSPIQGLFMGALSGVSQAAGIMIGKRLGAGEEKEAYCDSKRLMQRGFWLSLILSLLLVLLGRFYVQIFQVEDSVRLIAYKLLVVFAVVAPVKVQNMILGGGIIRSGGRTKYAMLIDIIGTWGFGVPLGFLSAYVLHLPITGVYFILSMEECVRLVLSAVVFRRRKWMQSPLK